MTNDETWQAYNDWGGYSLYTGTPPAAPGAAAAGSRAARCRSATTARSRRASTRPGGQDFFFYAEFPMIGFMEKNGYDVSYVSQRGRGRAQAVRRCSSSTRYS